jgi:hypothetical protein
MLAGMGLFWNTPLFANTAIIAFGTPEFVIIGADSKMTTLDGRITRTGCKIGVSKNIVWASALFTEVISHNSVKVDVNRIAYESIQSGLPLKDVVADFESRIQPAIIPVIAGIAKADPHFFNQKIRGYAVVEIVFVGIYDNEVHTFARDFQVEANSNVTQIILGLHRFDCPSSDCPTGGLIRFGTHNAIDGELARNPDIWNTLGIVPAIEKLIEIQMATTPNIVGGPIAIVKVSRSGADWLKTGACHNAQPN